MRWDCHIHMVLDGVNWREAIQRHSKGPDEAYIRAVLAQYQSNGVQYLRDGGDRWGVSKRARELAPDYGIEYRTPLAPLCHAGHYGAFIGEKYSTLSEYTALVQHHRAAGCDFIKLMISGLMDFDHVGQLSEPGLPAAEIRELIHIAHQEGLAVMAHANGARTVQIAAEAGADSIEHGAYLDSDALDAMLEAGTIWVPTLSTIGNLRGRGRFDERAVREILSSALANIHIFAAHGGLLAPGTDAGAWAVPHGSQTEFSLFQEALGGLTEEILQRGAEAIVLRFRPEHSIKA